MYGKNLNTLECLYNKTTDDFYTYSQFIENNGMVEDFITYHTMIKAIPELWRLMLSIGDDDDPLPPQGVAKIPEAGKESKCIYDAMSSVDKQNIYEYTCKKSK